MTVKSGTLGGGNLASGVEQIAYECVAPAIASGFTVSFCNKNATAVKVRLSIGSGVDSSAAGTAFLEYDAIIQPNEPLERTGIVISVGKKIFVKSDTANVDFAVYGFEK